MRNSRSQVCSSMSIFLSHLEAFGAGGSENSSTGEFVDRLEYFYLFYFPSFSYLFRCQAALCPPVSHVGNIFYLITGSWFF